ncbi:pentapeptide repeat-containing protein [Mycolicibacterium sp. lyk4-40-TYG-92]|uniref:pentapeptide repeat-containing protein n=1 Tax=Mycolicibacterium sp. lyk4-40-TYG-92 TaxID=3040295 RepID=UPI002550F693|nr:pentapeptide repeat-containing protein [Mycolicibacterium sp. lyk4-40-TYG-92]
MLARRVVGRDRTYLLDYLIDVHWLALDGDGELPPVHDVVALLIDEDAPGAEPDDVFLNEAVICEYRALQAAGHDGAEHVVPTVAALFNLADALIHRFRADYVADLRTQPLIDAVCAALDRFTEPAGPHTRQRAYEEAARLSTLVPDHTTPPARPDLAARWMPDQAEAARESLLGGKPQSPFGDHNGRIDLRGLRIGPADAVNPAKMIYELDRITVTGVDLSDGTYTQCRWSRTKFVDCRFDRSRFDGLRTYSARFDRCSFIDADLREASLGGWTKRWGRRVYGAQYTDCDFTNADLRYLNVGDAWFRGCAFVGSRWLGTRTMSAVFKDCDFRDATLREVTFDGRELGAGIPRRRGTNRLAGCDFTTTHLHGCSFIAIDFRDCVPPAGPELVLIDNFPARAQAAVRYLRAQPHIEAHSAAAVLDIEAGPAMLLPADAVGLLDLQDLNSTQRELLGQAFGI